MQPTMKMSNNHITTSRYFVQRFGIQLIIALASILTARLVPAQEMDIDLIAGGRKGSPCYPSSTDIVTNHFFYSASLAQGAVGDVVGIDFSLTLKEPLVIDGAQTDFGNFGLVRCYDGNQLELLDKIQYSEEFEAFSSINVFYSFDEDSNGVFLLGGLAESDLLEIGVPFHFMTLFFRIRGQPGIEVPITI